MQIWKWTLDRCDQQTLRLPTGARLLTVQMQGSSPCLWALCDETSSGPKEPRTIALYGTGHQIFNKEPGEYIATFQTKGGIFVWHAFELKLPAVCKR